MDAATARTRLTQARTEGRAALSEVEAKEVLDAFEIATPRRKLLPAMPERGFAAGLSAPFALKVVSRDILHKTESGGVQLGLRDEAAAVVAITAMRARIQATGSRIDGWLLEEMAPRGVEVVVGGLHDRRFGPVIMCGLGGVLVELLQDVAFAICPIDATDCVDMVESLRGAALLRGWRGAPPASLPALQHALLSVGRPGGLLDTLGDEIAELDINPLIVSPSGATAVDARIVLRDAHGG